MVRRTFNYCAFLVMSFMYVDHFLKHREFIHGKMWMMRLTAQLDDYQKQAIHEIAGDQKNVIESYSVTIITTS